MCCIYSVFNSNHGQLMVMYCKQTIFEVFASLFVVLSEIADNIKVFL